MEKPQPPVVDYAPRPGASGRRARDAWLLVLLMAALMAGLAYVAFEPVPEQPGRRTRPRLCREHAGVSPHAR